MSNIEKNKIAKKGVLKSNNNIVLAIDEDD